MRLTGLRPSDLSSLAFARAFGRKNMPPAYFYFRPHTSGSSPVNKKKSLFRDFLMRLTGLRPSDLSSLAFARAFGRKNMPPAYFYSRPHTSGSSPVNKKVPFQGLFNAVNRA